MLSLQKFSPPVVILLSIQPRLLRELLRRAFAKIKGITVIGESTEKAEIESLLAQYKVQWIVMDTSDERRLEEFFYTLETNPAVALLGVARDGSSLKLHWLERYQRNIVNPSLEELIQLLRTPQLAIPPHV